MAMKLDYNSLRSTYTPLWNGMVVTKKAAANTQAKAIIAAKKRLQGVEALTSVPWYVIGLLLVREAGLRGGKLDFGATLHNGQRIIGTGKKTTIVPAGRGPFATFEEAAVDALAQYKGKEWTVEFIAYTMEKFNGFGYRQYRGIPSPYLWGGTNRQKPGKYIADNKYSATTMDPQIGGMAVLRCLMDLDTSVTFGPVQAVPVVPKANALVAPGIDVKAVQTSLKNLGYFEVGRLDGIAGGATAAAVTAFKVDRHMSGSAYLDQPLVDELGRALVAGWTRPVAAERSEATPADVRQQVPEVKASWRAKIGAKAATIGSGAVAIGTGIANQFSTAQSYIEPVQSYLANVPGWAWLLVIAGVAAAYWLVAKQAEDAGVASFQTGARR